MSEDPLEQPYENWAFLNLNVKRDRRRLRELLLPEGLSAEGVSSLPAEALLDYLLRPLPGKKRPLCKSIIIEHDYFDADFVATVSAFYSKGFRETPRACKRLHFFSCPVTELSLWDLSRVQGHYLGFSVVRPLRGKALGRTVLRPRREAPDSQFYTCSGRFEANVAGTTLVIHSAPYLEQDGRVQTCSSIAVYVSTSTIAQCFELPSHTTSEIMDKATSVLVGDRVGAGAGLTYEQMMSALREMGYDPIVFWQADPAETADNVYSYVESGIPPILLVELSKGTHHAISVVGYNHNRPTMPQRQTSLSRAGQEMIKYYKSSEWVSRFYIHDDQRGLFREVNFLHGMDRATLNSAIRTTYMGTSETAYIKADLDSWHCPLVVHLGLPGLNVPQEEIVNVWGMIVPLPRGIALSHLEAEAKSAWMISRCLSGLGERVPDDLVLRTYLVRSNDYKTRLLANNDVHPFIRNLYSGKPLPKWLWLTEMSQVILMNSPKASGIRIRGELLLDATGNPWPMDFLTFHWVDSRNRGLVATMTKRHGSIAEAMSWSWRLRRETPYPPLIR